MTVKRRACRNRAALHENGYFQRDELNSRARSCRQADVCGCAYLATRLFRLPMSRFGMVHSEPKSTLTN